MVLISFTVKKKVEHTIDKSFVIVHSLFYVLPCLNVSWVSGMSK